MTRRILFFLLFSFTLLIGLIWGVASTHYNFFPYKQLRNIKRIISPELAFNPYYYDRVSIFNTFQGNADIVMIGDSLTDFGEWNEILQGKSILNRGISGDRTDGVLKRLDSVIATGASKAFIMIGFNDINAEVDAVKIIKNYEDIILKLTDNGMSVFIQSILFINDNAKSPTNKIIAQVNHQLKTLSQNTQSVTYINLNSKLAPSGKLESQFTTDGIHLNSKGYEVWRDLLHLFIY